MLAILVILFAMLFAPMIASLDMVTVGQAKVTMQTSARNALNEMRREISNALYIYPVAGVSYLGSDGIRGTLAPVSPYDGVDGEWFVPKYSEIAFISPATANGSIVEPLAPRTRAGEVIVTVLTVELQNPDEEYSRTNPFVLVRKDGVGYQERMNAAGTVSWWDFGPDDEPLRNVLSPRGSFDIPATRSICTECGEVVEGYIEVCPADCLGEIIHVHDNVRFTPERVVAETLQPNDTHTLYHARHNAWAGFHNVGNVELNYYNGGFLQLGASELDPRIVMLNPASGNREIIRDSWEPPATVHPRGAEMMTTWNSDRGVVQVGASTGRWVNVPDPNASIVPGQYYPLQVQHERPDMVVANGLDDYDQNGNLTSAPRQWDLVPVYPTLGMLVCPVCGSTWSPTQYSVGDPCPDPACPGNLVSTAPPGSPAMPIAYRLDATLAGTLGRAKIVPGSVRVVLWGTANGQVYQTAYSETLNTNQAEIGREQFAVVFSDHGQRAEVRFSELDPPSPRMLTDAGITMDDFGVYIQYYYRRNYDPAAPEEDFVIRADYSTQEIMNLRLVLQRYIEPEEDELTGGRVLPDDVFVDRVSLEDQVRVRNLSQ